MFVAAYWWKVHPGKEAQFRKAWRSGTELIAERYGSLGSRLHWEELDEGEGGSDGAGGRFVGVAEWPDRATWQAAFDAKMAYDDPETRAAFVDAIADTVDEPLLLMEVTDDLLARE
ncbi:antibiotic biosynthesis monooxygenase [Pelagerythrobacter sp.]|uniref:antibiotic biosynthesis monooxygenase n=1 Tax=Pelagerythrobacter sp. TaxID=2800702 RepID=UPI0035AF6F1E